MNNSALLTPEWERIDLLGACVSSVRRGIEIPSEIGERLRVVQQDVNAVRLQEPWVSVVNQFGLESIDQDILACSLAPEAEPRLGWMYQELQSGLSTNYPTPALIRELFLMDSHESIMLKKHLQNNSPLFRNKILELDSEDQFQPIRPTERACKELLGWPENSRIEIPGAVHIPVNATWGELVLPERCLSSINEFLLWVSQRQRVENDWGARLSGGPVALFSGPSGTGKTFAAEVIANELGWPLFRVDLGMLVSKYIGETEKNLNALFDAAHEKQVVLLFDEADSLFSKRGEVKEARDRYANMEVSHLLSRIERHNGPCILTSNLRQHIDFAFTRRFQVVVEFPRPDEAARAKIWQLNFPPKAPIDAEIDPTQLGQEFKLSGGQIRNSALHAAILAAGEDESIGLKQVTRAVWTELGKKGGELAESSLGKYAEYLTAGGEHDSH